ncbi:uncharacterized protein LOC113790119 [Dermatophagoides pteronyssinus]|uniref:uncharacterized protein LOC113790119 n=1 Tax=Dermatophagoides pteronyssinus TaxID=6956 RepID=UPI003F66C7AB
MATKMNKNDDEENSKSNDNNNTGGGGGTNNDNNNHIDQQQQQQQPQQQQQQIQMVMDPQPSFVDYSKYLKNEQPQQKIDPNVSSSTTNNQPNNNVNDDNNGNLLPKSVIEERTKMIRSLIEEHKSTKNTKSNAATGGGAGCGAVNDRQSTKSDSSLSLTRAVKLLRSKRKSCTKKKKTINSDSKS